VPPDWIRHLGEAGQRVEAHEIADHEDFRMPSNPSSA
jgi:hypothetical protein